MKCSLFTINDSGKKIMPVPLAYLIVVAIWSTTPLAIKWSTDGAGFLFGVASRMCLGVVLALLLCAVFRIALPLHHRARLTYLASGIGVFCAMTPAYWAAQYIPSGWISVMYGMTPIFTSIIGTLFLGEKTVSVRKTGALVISVAGLYTMFHRDAALDGHVLTSVCVVLLGTLCYAATMIAVKAIGAGLNSTATMTGTLVVTTVLFLAAWYIGGGVPDSISFRAAGAIVYLGVVGSVLGFMLFYYVLQHVKATQAALVTLITPGGALLIGHHFNHEPLTGAIISGAALVLTGLLLFQFGDGTVRIRLTFRRETAAGALPVANTAVTGLSQQDIDQVLQESDDGKQDLLQQPGGQKQ